MKTRRRDFLMGLTAALSIPTGIARAGLQKRIISVGGSITETIYFLHREGVLVGADTTSRYPVAAMDLPKVGYMRSLSVEGVLSLNPTLVLAEEGSGPPVAMESLKSVGLPVQIVPEARSIPDVVEKTRLIASHVDAAEESEKLIALIEARAEAVRREIEGIQNRKRVLFLLDINDNSLMAAGNDTAAAAIVDLAGGQPAIAEFNGYRPLSAEAVHKADPDVILIMEHVHERLGGVEDIVSLPQFQGLRAVHDKAVVAMDGLLLLGFGPRTPDATMQLARHLYADQLALADLPPLTLP